MTPQLSLRQVSPRFFVFDRQTRVMQAKDVLDYFKLLGVRLLEKNYVYVRSI